MHNLKIIVRWTDRDGKHHRKEYDHESKARKAKAWLLDNGATSADIAVSMNGRPERSVPDPKPKVVQEDQQLPWWDK